MVKDHAKFPKTPTTVEINIQARRMVPNTFLPFWDHKELTGDDKGLDMIMELYDNGNATNKIINIQIKGTMIFERFLIKEKTVISYPLEIKTFLYALESRTAFLLFICDIKSNCSYYICLQDYYLENRIKIDNKIKKCQETINIRIPIINIADNDKNDLMREFSYGNYIPRSEL